MKHLFILFFLQIFFINEGFSQLPADSKRNIVFTKTEHNPTYKIPLGDYFQKALAGNYTGLNGQVELGIILDSAGKAKFDGLKNLTNVEIKDLQFREAVNKMDPWNPAIHQKRPVPFHIWLLLDFNNGKLKVEQVFHGIKKL
jgi:hypothetical protein